MGSFPIVIGPRSTDRSVSNATPETRRVRVFFSSRDLRRKAYLYIPPNPGAFFNADTPQSIPASALLIAPMEGIGPYVQVPVDRPLLAQIIIDSSLAGPPHPADHFWVDDGLGKVTTHLAATPYPAHANSAEFGLPPGWTATGAWRISTSPSDPCADSRTGRSAFVFNNPGTCTYEGSNASFGELTLPATPLPCNRSSTTLSFWHWSQTERHAGYDRREVRISVNGGAWQTVWQAGAQDFGMRGQWVQQRIDLSAHRGQSVRVQFYFNTGDNSYNNYAGWYVDDIEVK
jgi:hypothetical protein